MNQNIDNKETFSYILGIFTTIIPLIMVSIFLVYRIGPNRLHFRLYEILNITLSYNLIVDLPKNILDEILKIDGIISNIPKDYNPEFEDHNSILTRPDSVLTWALKANKKVDNYIIKSKKPYHFNPPTIHIRSNERLSEELKEYLLNQTRTKYSISTTQDGFRTTLPKINSSRKILLIGDSVAFGVGNDDENTIASFIQKSIGPRATIINAGVGGYNYEQIINKAKLECKRKRHNYSGLIYFMNQNDYLKTEEIKVAFEMLESIQNEFDNNIFVFFSTYMTHEISDLINPNYTNNKEFKFVNKQKELISKYCNNLGYKYADLSSIVPKHMLNENSIFSRFALFTDLSHFSPRGNKLIADRIIADYEF